MPKPKSLLLMIGSLLFVVALVGIMLGILKSMGTVGFAYGSIPGLIIVAVVGVGLTFLASRM